MPLFALEIEAEDARAAEAVAKEREARDLEKAANDAIREAEISKRRQERVERLEEEYLLGIIDQATYDRGVINTDDEDCSSLLTCMPPPECLFLPDNEDDEDLPQDHPQPAMSLRANPHSKVRINSTKTVKDVPRVNTESIVVRDTVFGAMDIGLISCR